MTSENINNIKYIKQHIGKLLKGEFTIVGYAFAKNITFTNRMYNKKKDNTLLCIIACTRYYGDIINTKFSKLKLFKKLSISDACYAWPISDIKYWEQ